MGILEKIKHLFLPTEKNNYRARLLHHDILASFLVLALLLNFIVKAKPKAAQVLGFATDITVDKLLYYTNQERIKHGLQPLKLNEKLSKAAKMKALDMFTKNYWAHYAPDGKTPWDFILQAGYEYEYAGENLAKNFMFSKDVVDAWMKSPSHRENILKKEYTDIGFAVENGILQGEETTLVVQLFGKPLKQITQKTEKSKSKGIVKKVSAETRPNKLPVYKSSKAKISTTQASFDFTLLLLFILSLTLIADYYMAVKLNLIRNTSNNLITFIFLSTIILSLFIIKSGSIL